MDTHVHYHTVQFDIACSIPSGDQQFSAIQSQQLASCDLQFGWPHAKHQGSDTFTQDVRKDTGHMYGWTNFASGTPWPQPDMSGQRATTSNDNANVPHLNPKPSQTRTHLCKGPRHDVCDRSPAQEERTQAKEVDTGT